MTVGPVQPGLGWAATPTGLSTTTRSSSSIDDAQAGDGLGHDRDLPVRAAGIDDLEPRARVQTGRSCRPGVPSRVTCPSDARSAARVRLSPNILARPASTRSPSRPSGTGSARSVAHRRNDGGRRARRPCSDSRTIPIAEQVMAESARLKTAKCDGWMKSTT